MENNIPKNYKNFLPSRNIQLIILVLICIGLGYLFIPKLITLIQKRGELPEATVPLGISLPEGDPVQRDTDGDGLPDWQEVLVGLDPRSAETNPGSPDMQTYQRIKETVGVANFEQEALTVDDTDKISLTLYDTLASESTNRNGLTEVATSAAIEKELANYIQSKKDSIKPITAEQITIAENSLSNNQAYAKLMKQYLADTPVTKNAPEVIQKYLDGTGSYEQVAPILDLFSRRINELKQVSVPQPILETHLEILNGVNAVYELVSSYNPATQDAASQIGTLALTQDAFINIAKSLGYLSIYLSVALDKDGYITY